MEKQVKIYGVERSGTNYLQFMFRKYFDIDTPPSLFGSKHKIPSLEAMAAIKSGNLNFVVIMKEPFAYAMSSIGWGRGKTKYVVSHSNDGIPFIRFRCRYFNKKYRAWLDFYNTYRDYGCLLLYECMLSDPYAAIQWMSTNFGLDCRIMPVENPIGVIGTDSFERIELFHLDFYAYKEYMGLMSRGIIKTIEREIDWDLVEEYRCRCVHARKDQSLDC